MFATGTGKTQRLLNLTDMAANIGQLAEALPMLHAFTGCDTTSSLYGKGKKLAYKIVKERPATINALMSLGESYQLDKINSALEAFTCKLYGSNNSSINETRFEMFRSNTSEKALPPDSGLPSSAQS